HRRSDGDHITRAAFVVPKKVAKLASERNRTRRRLRECYRLHPARKNENLADCDLIFMATPQTAGASPAELDAAIMEVVKRAAKRIESENSSGNRQIEAQKPDLAPTKTVENEAKSPVLPLTFATLAMIRFYQRFVSPSLPPSCRFEPTCSRYTYAAIERFGLWRGGFLGFTRICRCHPWGGQGADSVPLLFPETRFWHLFRPFSRRRFHFFSLKK
ncbi:MAG TPA: membrane protein insertion efficiency factor YidD, partial [Abditibacterium sp.]